MAAIIDEVRVPKEFHRRNKLLNCQRERIHDLYHSGYPKTKLAVMFSVSEHCISYSLGHVKKYPQKVTEKRREGLIKAMQKHRRYKKHLIKKGYTPELREQKVRGRKKKNADGQ